MGSTLPPTQMVSNNTGAKPKNSVHTLLGEHSNLVNLDNLVTDSKSAAGNWNSISIIAFSHVEKA